MIKINLIEIKNTLDIELEDLIFLLKSYIIEIEKYLINIELYIKENDFESILRTLHTIKGTSLNLEIKNIYLISKELEEHIKNNQYDNMDQYISQIRLILDEMKNLKELKN